MTITLPPLPRGAEYAIRHVRASETQRSGTRGSLTGLNRQGDHWAVEIDPGALATFCGRALLADIVRGTGERIRVPLPQNTGWSSTSLGEPRVNGGGQAGSLLSVDGLWYGVPILKGSFFTLETAEGSSAHIVTASVFGDEAGQADIPFWPMLWREPADNDVLKMHNPYIEGFIVDDGDQASGSFPLVRTDAFTIEEG